MARATNVVRLRPPPLVAVPIDDARALYEKGEFRACLKALSPDSSADAGILSARCFLRLSRLEEALERLVSAADAVRSSGDALRAEYALVVAATHHFLGHAHQTDEFLCEARVYTYSTRSRALESELTVLEAMVAWARNDLRQATLSAELSLSIAPTGHWRARALQMLGIVASARAKYKEQIDFYQRALQALDDDGDRCVWSRANLLVVLSYLARDLYRPELARFLSDYEQRVTWTAETEHLRFDLLRNVAWSHALAGDHMTCFRFLRQASAIAPSAPWRILTFCDRSALAREMGERAFAIEELATAQSFAGECDWSKVRGDEREALLRLAETTASDNVAEAQRLLEIYRKDLPPLAATALGANDNWRAVEDYAYGVVAVHARDYEGAVRRLTNAFRIWRSIDFVPRALEAAIRLAPLTGGEVFFEYARRHAGKFPGTWLARQAAELDKCTTKGSAGDTAARA
ncbi:MAG TPA: hypothetical protein VGD50_03345 [Candidatus Baltobacteraceae bacterium]